MLNLEPKSLPPPPPPQHCHVLLCLPLNDLVPMLIYYVTWSSSSSNTAPFLLQLIRAVSYNRNSSYDLHLLTNCLCILQVKLLVSKWQSSREIETTFLQSMDVLKNISKIQIKIFQFPQPIGNLNKSTFYHLIGAMTDHRPLH